jgi:hypothetical protein
MELLNKMDNATIIGVAIQATLFIAIVVCIIMAITKAIRSSH